MKFGHTPKHFYCFSKSTSLVTLMLHFLLLLPFLLHCQATLHLDDSQGLLLVSHRFRFKIQCFLGPMGALRIPIQQFTDSMVQFLYIFWGQQC